MDRKKTQATASATTEKHGEKKDENFLSKTAHSIRDKVHEFTDDVKEKTHQLTHSHDAKKNKKDKTEKKTGAVSKTSPKPRMASKKDSGSDSDDEDDSPSVPPAKRDNQREANKPDASGSKPAATLSTSSKLTSDKPTLTNKPSGDRKDNAAAASSSSAKPATAKPSNSSSNKDSKTSTDKPDKTADSGQPTNNKDRIHISLDGVSTVDDLLDRIDEAVERANIIVENNPSKVSVNLQKTLSAPVPSPVDLEKKPTERIKNKEEDNKDGPIRINYNEIQNLEDLLLSIEDQPGHRKILLENAPNNSGSTPVQKLLKSPGNVPLAPANSLASDASFSSAAAAAKSEDPSAGPKSILKTSQDPSSLDTSTKTSSFQNDQVHVNVEVEGGQVVNNLLDRIIDDAVHAVPTAVSIESPSEKRYAPQAPHQNELVARTSQKREAPKATSLPHNHGENTTSVTGFQYPNISSISTTESAHKEGKPDEKDASDWI